MYKHTKKIKLLKKIAMFQKTMKFHSQENDITANNKTTDTNVNC